MRSPNKRICLAVMFVMLSLIFCTAAFAESIDDVLKDCKLDRSRWKVIEWFKAEKFVRFYDSTSVNVTGPGQFDVILNDYYYGSTCRKKSCAQLGSKHYHIEKWGFNTAKSAGTLRSFSLKDANQETVDAYDYPTNMQIVTELNKKSIEAKTMLKIKDSLKNNKEFTKEVKPTPKETQPKITGLVPMPMPIGASDGEWTYLGRFIPPGNYSTLLEWETRMMPYTSSAESNNLYDVYYYHSHYGTGDGHGCYVAPFSDGKKIRMGFSCVLKFVPLDRNGRPEKKSGGPNGVHLFSMIGRSRGAFAAEIVRIRTFDSVTRQLLADITNTARKQNPKVNGRFYDTANSSIMNIKNNSPFYKAMAMTTCPTGDPLPY